MTRSTTLIRSSAAVLALIFAAACAKEEPHLGTSVKAGAKDGTSVVVSDSRSILPSGGLAGEESSLVEVEAKVVSIDVPTRTITLALPNGTPHVFKAPNEIRNFTQIQPGDQVRVAYRQKLSFELREPTEQELAMSGSKVGLAGRSPLGDLPGGAVVTAGLSVVTIESVSKNKEQVAVKTADGRIVTIQAKYPENLALVKKGQKAVVTYGESVVAEVERLQ